MTKKEVLDSLRDFSENFPKEALREIQKNKADFIPELLESLDYVYHNAKELYDENSAYYLHTYAMYLLAEFREKEAFPHLIKLLQLPDDHIDFIFGGSLTEGLPQLLFSTFDMKNLQMLFDLIENPEYNEWARVAAVKVYEFIYREGFISQEEFASYLRSLIYDKLPDDDSYCFFTFIVGSVIDTNLVQMIQDVRFLYDNDKVDASVYGRYDDFIDCIFRDREKEKCYIHDAVSEMSWWACFDQETDMSMGRMAEGIKNFIAEGIKTDIEQNKAIAQKQKKLGRNDPCPCGSGKKYKKCCYDLPQKSGSSVIRLEDKYDLLERYPKDVSLFQEMYEEEAVRIDMLAYKALHHRAIPLWVERDREQERIGKIYYLKEALDLFLDKCGREQITSFTAYDEQYMVHYYSNEWISALTDLIEDFDSPEIALIQELATATLQRFEQ